LVFIQTNFFDFILIIFSRKKNLKVFDNAANL